jgi:Holliday junction resolvase RusA-like endonuclease
VIVNRKLLESLQVSTKTLLEIFKAEGVGDLLDSQIERIEGMLALMKSGNVSKVRVQSCQIPIPPSANHLTDSVWRGKGKVARVKTKEHREFADAAEKAIRLAMLPVQRFPVQIHISIIGSKGFPISRDVSNCAKAAEDALVRAEIIPDDKRKFVFRSSQEFIEGKGESACFLSVIEPEVGA